MATSTSSAAEGSLEKVRTEIALSKEWKDIHEAISEEVKKLMKEEATKDGHEAAMMTVSEGVQKKYADKYQLMEEHVLKTVQQHFFSSSFLSKPKPNMQLIDQASAMLVKRRPEFKVHLKSYINVPLPLHLRKATWNAFLIDEKIKQDFYDTHKDMKSISKDHRTIVEKCKNILQLNALSELQLIEDLPYAISTVVRFWEKTTSNEVTDAAIFLCVPFVYCCRNGLASNTRGETLNWTIMSEVAEMYGAFMNMMPLSMRNMLHNPEHVSAATVLCKQVETLLSLSNRKLATHLRKVLPISKKKDSSDEFSQLLLQLVHPFYQKLFIGACTMELCCFILDQCLIFLEIPNSKFMPYCMTTWIILNKKKILNCQDFESVKNVLRTNSVNISVEEFRKELDTRFVSDMTSGADIQIDHEEKDERHSLVASRQRKEQNGEESKPNKDQDDLTVLKQQVADLLKYQTQQARESEDHLTKEREAHRKEIQELRKEMVALKDKSKEKESSQKHETSGHRQRTHGDTRQTTRLSTRLTETREGPSSNTHSTIINRPTPQSSRKKYDPESLTSSDIQELNTTIMSKFREAMYLVCHGTDEEKEELQKVLKKRKPH